MEKKFVTIKDIALALGISKSTVSRALADRFDVKPETRIAVMEMAQKMNYTPNPYAISLANRQSKIIGVVVPEFTNSFFPRIIMPMQQVFEQHGYNVLISQSNESAERERKNLELFEESMVDGIIISEAQKDINADYYTRLMERGIPVVFFNRVSQSVDASKVIIDDYRMAYFAVEHLILNNSNQKRERVMHLKGPVGIFSSMSRFRGYNDVMHKYSLNVSEDLVLECPKITRQCGYDTMLRAIDRGVVPDAVFAFNDMLAIGAMKAIKRRGLRIPEDVSVMGFSESQSALLIDPALSSVAQPLEQMGETVAKLLLEKIDNPKTKNVTVVLEAKINVRGSSDVSKVGNDYL